MPKTCARCRVVLTHENAYTVSSRNGAFQSQCRLCSAAYRNEWLARNKEKELARRKGYYEVNKDRITELNEFHRVKRKYGVTPDQVAAHRSAIGNLCEICKESPATDIDHCHDSGLFRGLLCNHCNNGIGRFFDDTDRLRGAIEYLERFSQRLGRPNPKQVLCVKGA